MKSKNTLLTLLVIALLISNFFMFTKIEDLNNSINNVNNQFHWIDNSINNIGNNVRNQLNAFREESAWIRDSSITPIKYDDSDESSTIDIHVDFNSLLSDEVYYLLIQNKDEKTIDKIDVSSSIENLQLNYIANLPIDDYYFTFIAESPSLQRSDDVGKLELKSRLEHTFDINGFGNSSNFDKDGNFVDMSFDLIIYKHFEYQDFFADYFKDYKITGIYANIIVDGDLLDKIDILNSENWEQMKTHNNNEEEEVVREEMGLAAYTSQEIFYSGTYTFESLVQKNQNVQIIIEIVDNRGKTFSQEIDN